MAVTKKELDEFMGFPGVPFTFPTLTVQSGMQSWGVNLSTSDVDKIWDIYKAANLAGTIPAYREVNGSSINLPIVNYLVNASGFPLLTIAAWLKSTESASYTWGDYWIDPLGTQKAQVGSYSLNPVEDLKTLANDIGSVATTATTAIANTAAPILDPVTNLVKWAAIFVVGGAVVYGLYKGTNIFKARKRRKG